MARAEKMARERYPGERVGLLLFLQGLLPLVHAELGPSSLLLQAIRRSMVTNNLEDLRRARRMFNLLPVDVKRRLSAGIVAQQSPQPAQSQGNPAVEAGTTRALLCLEKGGSARRRVSVTCDFPDDVAVRVLVRPGTLPSSAAEELRQIATLIDSDRRVLSDRYWPSDRDGAKARDDGQVDHVR
jgi:hypothetical protein